MSRAETTKTDKKRKMAQAIDLLAVLSHPVRLSILCNLYHMGEMNVGSIVDAEAGSASQSQISQFLALMRTSELVSTRKEGQTVYYRIASKHAENIISALYKSYCG